jgi:multidrug resistance protein MdtO
MAAFPAASTTQPSRVLRERTSLLDFLRRELAPFPGRGLATCRIVVACVVVLVVCMTLRVPEAHLAVWVVFKIALEESGETLLTGIVALVAITVAIVLALFLLFIAMDQAWLRFCLIGVMAAVALFLRRTFVIGTFGFVLGLVSIIVLTVPDFVPAPELIVRATLWIWPVFALGIAGAVAANLLIAPTDPARLLREELVKRVCAAEGAIARRLGRPADAPEAARFAMSGVARLLALLRSAEVLHPSVRPRHAQQSAVITLVDRLVTAAEALDILSLEPHGGEREWLEALAAACARVRRALEDGATLTPAPSRNPSLPAGHGSAMLPVIAELEHVVALLQQALGPEGVAGGALTAGAPEPPRRSLFVADAFRNPEYVRYALKGALAVMICYLLQSAVDWPGIRTCIITCMIVGLTSEGATIQKGILRIAGALVGGAMGFLAIMLVIPGTESITSLALLVAAGTAVAAWVYVGSACISYAGVQIAFAFYVCVIQGFAPSWDFYTIRDRLIGILLGNAVITMVFLSVWPVRAGAAMWASFASALRAMADLARVGSRSDDQTVVAREIQGLRLQAYRHFATAQQSVEEEAFEWTASGADVAAARDRFQAATAEAQSVFLTQLAVASQRPNVAPSELPEGLVTGARRFDAVVAESLDVIADRAETAATRDPPDLRLPLAAVTGVMRAEIPRIANPEVVVQVEGRLALYRELVPRLERLGSGGLIG